MSIVYCVSSASRNKSEYPKAGKFILELGGNYALVDELQESVSCNAPYDHGVIDATQTVDVTFQLPVSKPLPFNDFHKGKYLSLWGDKAMLEPAAWKRLITGSSTVGGIPTLTLEPASQLVNVVPGMTYSLSNVVVSGVNRGYITMIVEVPLSDSDRRKMWTRNNHMPVYEVQFPQIPVARAAQEQMLYLVREGASSGVAALIVSWRSPQTVLVTGNLPADVLTPNVRYELWSRDGCRHPPQDLEAVRDMLDIERRQQGMMPFMMRLDVVIISRLCVIVGGTNGNTWGDYEYLATQVKINDLSPCNLLVRAGCTDSVVSYGATTHHTQLEIKHNCSDKFVFLRHSTCAATTQRAWKKLSVEIRLSSGQIVDLAPAPAVAAALCHSDMWNIGNITLQWTLG